VPHRSVYLQQLAPDGHVHTIEVAARGLLISAAAASRSSIEHLDAAADARGARETEVGSPLRARLSASR